MNTDESILIVEDDDTIRALLEMALRGAGYTAVATARRGDEALAEIRRTRPDLVLLDLMLPGLDGLAIARAVRGEPSLAGVRIIMLTARTTEEDIIAGLEAGADDYVTKPYDRRVLLARVKAVLRRQLPVAEGVDFDGLVLDDEGRTAILHGETLALTAGEYQLLRRLVAHRGRVLTRAADARTVDVQIANLRRKLGAWADHIETIRGIGYRIG